MTKTSKPTNEQLSAILLGAVEGIVDRSDRQAAAAMDNAERMSTN